MAYFLLNAVDNTVREVSDQPFSTRYEKFNQWKIIEIKDITRAQYLKDNTVRVEMDNLVTPKDEAQIVWKYFDKASGNWYQVKERPVSAVKYDEEKKSFVDMFSDNIVNKEIIKTAPAS